jgi:hypothetical protein
MAVTRLVDATGKGFAVHDQLHKVSVNAVLAEFYEILNFISKVKIQKLYAPLLFFPFQYT